MTVLLRYSIQNFQEFPIRRLFPCSKIETKLFKISAYAPFFQAIIFVLSISCHRKIDNVRGLIIHEPFPVLEEGGGRRRPSTIGEEKKTKKPWTFFQGAHKRKRLVDRHTPAPPVRGHGNLGCSIGKTLRERSIPAWPFYQSPSLFPSLYMCTTQREFLLVQQFNAKRACLNNVYACC